MDNKKTNGLKAAYIAAASVFFFGVIASVVILTKPESNIAQIVKDGEILYTFNLDFERDQSLKIECGDGYNIIDITERSIRVSDASCPDKTCVKMGRLVSGVPIVCLPHKLVIRFVKNGGAVDATAK